MEFIYLPIFIKIESMSLEEFEDNTDPNTKRYLLRRSVMDLGMGSIGGGGRYDNLTGLFGVPNIPGVGISFGVDRIYDVMEESNLFPDKMQKGVTALFFNMGDEESKFVFKQMQQLRNKGISCELFHGPAKMDKQFKYAVKKNIEYAIIIGNKEKPKARLGE